jgi:hypothetical protein
MSNSRKNSTQLLLVDIRFERSAFFRSPADAPNYFLYCTDDRKRHPRATISVTGDMPVLPASRMLIACPGAANATLYVSAISAATLAANTSVYVTPGGDCQS